MRVTFLGTNGWYDTSTGNTICTLITTEKFNILLDAGNGLFKADRYMNDEKMTCLFLSHFHLDHIIGLHVLNKFSFSRGLHIWGQTGAREILQNLINLPFSMPFGRLGYKTEIHELPGDKGMLPFPVEFLPLVHSSFTLGYRFEVEGRVVAYCTDTGYCENAVQLGRNADLLITECAYKTGQSWEGWPHLNPEGAARIAREAGAKRLALVHFDAAVYRTLEERKEAEASAQAIFPNTVAALDDMQIDI